MGWLGLRFLTDWAVLWLGLFKIWVFSRLGSAFCLVELICWILSLFNVLNYLLMVAVLSSRGTSDCFSKSLNWVRSTGLETQTYDRNLTVFSSRGTSDCCFSKSLNWVPSTGLETQNYDWNLTKFSWLGKDSVTRLLSHRFPVTPTNQDLVNS